PLPESEDRGRPSRRGLAVLAISAALHASLHGDQRALPGSETAQAHGERIPEEQRLDHHQRHAVGAGDPLLPGSAGRRSRALRDGLPVSVRAGRGEGDRRDEDQRGGAQAPLPDQRGAALQALKKSGSGPKLITALTPNYLLKRFVGGFVAAI